MANMLVISGVITLTVAGWVCHPAAGLGVLGVALTTIGIGIVRDEQRKQRGEE